MSSKFDPQRAVKQTAKETLKELGVDAKTGLDQGQVSIAEGIYGKNVLEQKEGKGFWERFIEQFDDPLVKILLAAAVISFVLALMEESQEHLLTAYAEPVVILVILIANAFVGAWQEQSADAAIEALKEFSPLHATVIRDGKEQTINASDVVPGDIVIVSSGDQIPADMRLIQMNSTTLKIDQAILTGESVSVQKTVDAIKKEDIVNQDKHNILFSGTNVASGKGIGVVIGIGENTEIGKIHSSLQEEEDDDTPLSKKIAEFGDWLCNAIMVICVLVWIINIGHFNDPIHGGSWVKGAIYYFKIAVALAVAAIPEGLPAVITTCLALGTRRMAKKNALVRKLPSVETLGCTSVICSDKTGTLTTNQMSVTDFFVMASNSALAKFEVEGDSFTPRGRVTIDGKAFTVKSHPAVAELAKVCAVCNESTIEYVNGAYGKLGEATEAALTVLVEKLNVKGTDLSSLTDEQLATACNRALQEECSKDGNKGFTLEFSRDRKSMSAFVTEKNGETKMYVKGQAAKMLERCSHARVGGKKVKLTNAMRDVIMAQVAEYASGNKALRCLAMAVIEDPGSYGDVRGRAIDTAKFAEIESNMTFIGVTGMIDPPRKEVKPCIEDCNRAHIKVIVITGDVKETATAICRRIGVFQPEENVEGLVYSGSQFDKLSNEEQYEAAQRARLFCQVEPKHKQKIVEHLKNAGFIVAMTGDGVNDPQL
jgi:Ca2+ transporting ATPase